MSRRITYVVSALAALFMLLLVAVVLRNRSLTQSLNSAEIKSQRFDAHCRAIRVALQAELADAAADSDAAQRERHNNQIFEQLTSPGVGFTDCSAKPIDQAHLAVCWANHDTPCIESIGRSAIESLPR